MKKEKMTIPIQFRASPTQNKIIRRNAERAGYDLSDYLRILGMADLDFKVVLQARRELHVSEARLGSETTEGRKRAAG